MLALLSPAKTTDMSPVKGATTTPVLKKHSEELVTVLQKLSPAEMKRRDVEHATKDEKKTCK